MQYLQISVVSLRNGSRVQPGKMELQHPQIFRQYPNSIKHFPFG
jgi:hypothetical protein